MDLDDLRRGLDEAATARPVDVPAAHRTVADRSRRRVRRRRTLASSAVVGTAITIVASVLALAGGPTGPSPSTVPGTAAPPAHPAYQPLPSRDGAALAYDAARRQAVLFGGFDNTHSLADTWLWDGHGWSEAHPSVSPPARDGATMAYDPASRTVLLFGGTYQPDTRVSTELDDTWSWDGKTWTDVSGAHRPPWSNGTAMSYDPASRSMILLTLPASHPNLDVTPNGVGSRGNTPFGTWRWTGRDWTELATPTAPLFAIGAVFHGDPRLAPLPDGKGLLFYSWAVFTGSCPAIVVNGHTRSACDNGPDPSGTRDSQTYTWDGSHWTKQQPARAPGSADVLVAPGAAPGSSVPARRGRGTARPGCRSTRPAHRMRSPARSPCTTTRATRSWPTRERSAPTAASSTPGRGTDRGRGAPREYRSRPPRRARRRRRAPPRPPPPRPEHPRARRPN